MRLRSNIKKHLIAFNESIKNQCNCTIGKQYKGPCVPGDPCSPVEGSFVVECSVNGCKNIGK